MRNPVKNKWSNVKRQHTKRVNKAKGQGSGILILLVLALALGMCAQNGNTREPDIRAAVAELRQLYTANQIRRVYKCFRYKNIGPKYTNADILKVSVTVLKSMTIDGYRGDKAVDMAMRLCRSIN